MSGPASRPHSWQETSRLFAQLSGHAEEDFAVLREFSAVTRPWIEGAIEDFYDTLFAEPESRAVFQDGERGARAETLRAWLREILDGVPEESFWNRQWTVGLVHIQRHVRPAFMLAMMSRVQQRFLGHCIATLGVEDALRVFGAFKRISDIVAGLAIEGQLRGYIDAISDVTGMKSGLVDRMADVAVARLLEQARRR